MNLVELAKTVTKYGAPLLGMAIGGPQGATLGKLVAQWFANDTNDPDKLIQAIEQDPQSSEILQKIESNERIEIARILAEQKRIEIENEVKDRESARNFSSKDMETARNLTYILIIGSLGAIFIIPFLNPDSYETSLMAVLITMLVQAAKDSIRAWFGRSFKSDNGE